jgi:two-component system, OmpR family, sensor kinase
MTKLAEVPIRLRITAAFATVMLVLLAGVAVVAYLNMRAALLDEIDTGLRFRASSMLSVPESDFVERRSPGLDVQHDETFDQLLWRDGKVLRETPGLSSGPLLTARQLAGLRAPQFYQRPVHGVEDDARLLAVPLTGADRGKTLLVGATTADRTDALRQLSIGLIGGGVVSIGLASLAGWFVAGLTLRPVERMRRQASAITASDLDRRLEVPSSRDELQRLAATLNDMLARLDQAVSAEDRFLERASHELRTPLAALQAELELAGSRPRSPAELSSALASAAEETDRIVRLANDLLSRARSRRGVLPVRRENTDLQAFLSTAIERFRSRALTRSQQISVAATSRSVWIDPVRVRQALDNLIDNALRHTPDGGTVEVTGQADDHDTRITVRDNGPGFSPIALTQTAGSDGPGLGLQIVKTVAAGHDGAIELFNHPAGGAVVTMRLPNVPPSSK